MAGVFVLTVIRCDGFSDDNFYGFQRCLNSNSINFEMFQSKYAL